MADKHTPGPWFPFEMRKVRMNSEVIPVGIPGEAGMMTPMAWVPSWLNDAPEEAVANSHLIAAAPELLEALEVIAGGDLDVSHTAIIVGNGAATVLAQVRAAIAKARGAA